MEGRRIADLPQAAISPWAGISEFRFGKRLRENNQEGLGRLKLATDVTPQNRRRCPASRRGNLFWCDHDKRSAMLTSDEPGVFAVVHLHFKPVAQRADIGAAALSKKTQTSEDLMSNQVRAAIPCNLCGQTGAKVLAHIRRLLRPGLRALYVGSCWA